jgi:hypothetical protein
MSAQMAVLKAGPVLAIIIGGWHLCWSVLVALGWAQPLIDFVFWIHFIKPIYVIEPFEVTRAAILVLVTASIGYVLGSIFALVWNTFHRA